MAWGKNYYRENNNRRKQYYKPKRYYDNRNRFWAVVCLVASAAVCTLPWMTLEFFGETLGGISLYTAASHIDSLQALFNTYRLFGVSDFTMANVSLTLTGVSLLAGLIVILFWRRLAGLSWLCGVLNIGAAGAWILFM